MHQQMKSLQGAPPSENTCTPYPIQLETHSSTLPHSLSSTTHQAYPLALPLQGVANCLTYRPRKTASRLGVDPTRSSNMAASDGASSISVAVRVRPFTIREAAQITRCDEGPLFLGDGSLAGAPTPKLNQKGIRSIVKVIDDRCL